MVKQYFYGNSDEKLKTSSFDQFYYGNAFVLNSNLIGVTYYGTSKEESGISGYQLALFNNEGELLNSLLIAGTRGIFDIDIQIEANIKKDKIILNRIELDLDKVQDLSRFEGKQKFVTYQVCKDGSLKKNEETEYQVRNLTANEHKNYRIEIIE